MTLPGDDLPLGHLHPITQTRREIEDAFLGLGYEVRDDREVETTRVQLRQARLRPMASRALAPGDVLLDETHVLRTETSPSQIHAMEEREPPIYMVSIGRCLPA